MMPSLRKFGILCILLALSVSFTQSQGLPVFRIGVLDEPDGTLTRGAQLAVAEVNESGGVLGADGTAFQLQLVIQSPQDLQTAVNNINQASVIAVIGPPDSTTVLGNRELLATLNVPTLTTATDDALLANDQSNLLFRLRAPESLQGRAIADYIVNDLSAASVATVQLDIESTVSVIGFQRASESFGLISQPQLILSDTTPIERIISTIVAGMPQFVAAYGPPEQTAELYTRLREADWPGRFIYNQAGEADFRSNVQESLLSGIISVASWSPSYTDVRSETFTLAYARAFDEVPHALSAAAYDAVFLIQTAINQPGDLRTNLRNINAFVGIQGILTPALLADGEISNNVSVNELGEFGVPQVVARFSGAERIPMNDEVIVETATPTPAITATPDGVFLTITRAVQNVRTGPGLEYQILGQLQEGSQAQIIGANINFSWVAINFRGTTGWLSRPILDVSGNTNTVAVFTPPPPPPTPTPTTTPTAQPFPDIVITSALPTRLVIGTPFNVSVTLRNQGAVDAGTFAVAATFEPGSQFAAINLPGLAANTQTTINLSGTLSGGTGPQPVTIVADLNNQVNEGQAGEANNSTFILNYIADAPLLTSAPATGTFAINDLGTAAFDGGTDDIQWGAGGIVPLGNTQLVRLSNFSNLEQVHRDAIANATLQPAPITNVTAGELIGILTDTEGKYGVLQIVNVVPGGAATVTYRMYEN